MDTLWFGLFEKDSLVGLGETGWEVVTNDCKGELF
jgi:hypothetical protein